MAREKKPVHKVQMTDGKRNIIHQLLQEYDIQSAEDIQDALKDLLGGTIKEMMETEMDEHLGYGKSERSDNDDYRNGYKSKRINSSYGSMDLQIPQDRKSTFEPQVVKKRQKDISDIDQKIISMYAKGMTTRQISDTLEDIYGFKASEGFISDVTDKIMPQIEDWQNRPLSEVYPKTEYQRCIVHQVRNTMKYVSDKDRKPFCADLKTIYHAATEEKALEALERVTEKWSEKYPNSMRSWKQNWDALSPIFKFSAVVRKVIYTTNAIESLNATYRKLNRQRSVFPSDTALLKALYLSTFEATKKWSMPIRNWGQVYGELSIMYEGRLPE